MSVQTAAATLFISDLHLCNERPPINALFLDFLRTSARSARALYILGDLFEFWIGDEACELDEFRPLVTGLRELTQSGVPLYVMHGNRDFLMGAGFENATGAKLLNDPCIIDLYGERVLLAHGDALCTDDTQYMEFRAMVRSRPWQTKVLSQSVPERLALAAHYREASKVSSASKKPEIMDVNMGSVEGLMREHHVRTLIHGHTHRPFDHRLTLDGVNARRIVLGDWYEQGSVLVCEPGRWQLRKLPLHEAATLP